MLRKARLCDNISSVCPSVCPSMRLRYVFHTGWNTSKIISRKNSLRHLLTLTPTGAIWSNGNTPKIRMAYIYIGVGSGAQKPAISPKPCKIGPRLLLRTNRKSHTGFRLAPKSMTLDDLEGPKRHSCRNKQKLWSPS